jgi:hypothetical protein
VALILDSPSANIPLLKTPKCRALHFGVIRILKFAEGNMTNQVSEVTSISSNQFKSYQFGEAKQKNQFKSEASATKKSV